MNQDLLTLLESFNRKERYFVVAQATGTARMRLGSEFHAELGERIGLSVPQSASVYLDYHLDWLFAAKAMVSGAHDGEHRECRERRGREPGGHRPPHRVPRARRGPPHTA